ncbi:hypothetical protein M0802_012310 [Mischocyttarus mexicanus]|nr:hypothetical protein M0802_012310 [Mischocyttarus mexicanus]
MQGGDLQHCGMHSYTSAVPTVFAEYRMKPTARQFQTMHNTRTIAIVTSTQLFDLKVNVTTSRAVILPGAMANDSSCSGIQYSDSYGSWSDVIVQATVNVMLTSSVVQESQQAVIDASLFRTYLEIMKRSRDSDSDNK